MKARAWTHIWTYDPAPALERLRVPVLAIYGEWDATVSPDVNRAHLERALARAGNRELTVRVFSKANHHFLLGVTGAPREVDLLTGFVPGYVDARASWLTEGPVARKAGRPLAMGAATVADGRVVLSGRAAPWRFPRPHP